MPEMCRHIAGNFYFIPIFCLKQSCRGSRRHSNAGKKIEQQQTLERKEASIVLRLAMLRWGSKDDAKLRELFQDKEADPTSTAQRSSQVFDSTLTNIDKGRYRRFGDDCSSLPEGEALPYSYMRPGQLRFGDNIPSTFLSTRLLLVSRFLICDSPFAFDL